MKTLWVILFVFSVAEWADIVHTYLFIGLDEARKRFLQQFAFDRNPYEAFFQHIVLAWFLAICLTIGLFYVTIQICIK